MKTTKRKQFNKLGLWDRVKLASELMQLTEIAEGLAKIDPVCRDDDGVPFCPLCQGELVGKGHEFKHFKECPKVKADEWKRYWGEPEADHE